MSDSIEVRRSVAADDAARDAFVEAHPRASFFHLTGWRNVVRDVFGHEPVEFVALDRGELVGVLPVMACRGLRGGRALISMPYAVYGGAIGATQEVEHALFRAAERHAVEQGVARLELRCLDDPGLEVPRSDLYATFIRELPARPEDVLGAMPKKARADARKARKDHGLTLDEGPWFVADLVRLFHRNKRSLGSPAMPARWFSALLREFGDRATVHLVRRESEPLAAVMSFFFRDTVLAYHSGTAEDADRSYKASAFMYMALQEWSIAEGYRVFDFGRSRKDSGPFSFKVHQGFEPRDLNYRYRLVRDRETPSLNPSNPKTKVLRDTWSRLPLWVTTALSTPAAKYLP
ncbi:MAG: FemAB family PEP-CTERM system-associated protein [Planctomycetota bacterium]